MHKLLVAKAHFITATSLYSVVIISMTHPQTGKIYQGELPCLSILDVVLFNICITFSGQDYLTSEQLGATCRLGHTLGCTDCTSTSHGPSWLHATWVPQPLPQLPNYRLPYYTGVPVCVLRHATLHGPFGLGQEVGAREEVEIGDPGCYTD